MTEFRNLIAVVLLIMLSACAAAVPIPAIPPPPGADFDPAAVAVPDARHLADFTPFPKTVPPMPASGARNAFGGTTEGALADAWTAQQRNDTQTALEALTKMDGSSDPLTAWLASYIRVQVLLAAGRAAEAEALLPETTAREKAWIGHDLNSEALRGEVLVWIGDYAAARYALATIAHRTADWRLPVSYGGPPTNLGQLVSLTTAQLRAQTALGALEFLEGNAEAARDWAAAAEARYSDVHYVAGHSLYGPHLPTHYDSFYGRALNLGVLAAAQTQTADAAADETFAAARQAVEAIGWTCGTPFVLALRAQAFLAAGRSDDALAAADEATRAATARGCADFVWRIEALRGEALLVENRNDEALTAFDRAQHAVAAVTGALSGDTAKLRFGIGKETIVRRLAQLLAARGDLPALFDALERGRARAFVDLLAQQSLGTAAEDADAIAVRDLGDKVRQARLAALAPESEPVSQDALDALLSQRAARLAALAARRPDVAELLNVEEPDLNETQAALGSQDILLYALPLPLGDRVRWLAVRRDGLALREGDLTGRELGRLLNSFVQAGLQDRRDTQSQVLSRITKGIGIGDLPTGTVYVVPSGPLYRVPWGVVVPKRAVAVLPTASMLPRLTVGTASQNGAVVVGDPDFAGTLPALPGAREEAGNVGSLLGADPLIGPAATETALREQVGRGVQVLHLATHGRFDAIRPLSSAVFLTANRLTAADLFSRPLSADLVVLSACETGLGKAVAGDDYLGLARSFYLGGTRTLVHSLWPVADGPTRQFMTVFHERAKDGNLGTAWRAATDALTADGLPPFIAGAFVLGGAPRR